MSNKRLIQVNISPDNDIELVFAVSVRELMPVYEIGNPTPVTWSPTESYEERSEFFTDPIEAQAMIDLYATPHWHPRIHP